MKKFILILLVSVMVIACFSGCDILDGGSDGEQMQAPYEIHKNPTKQVNEEKIEEDVRAQLSNYLYSLGFDYGLTGYTFEGQINSVKNGARPILVSFNPNDRYYVCAYYSAAHEHPEGDGDFYCCVDNYTWVKFDKATEISESYNNDELIAAFQINGSALTSDLLSEKVEVPIIQHFQMFEPEFTDGFNTKEPEEFKETYIYLYGSNQDVVLFCASNILTRSLLINCLYYENEYYISHMIQKEIDGKDTIIVDLEEKFGEYYDYLTDPVREKIYEETNSVGKVTSYLLTDLNSFIGMVN